jgi:hypothetical protein
MEGTKSIRSMSSKGIEVLCGPCLVQEGYYKSLSLISELLSGCLF